MTEKLRIENLTIIRQQKKICHALSLRVKAGQFWGILGSNGRGKTTLLHTLARLRPPAEGKIWLQNTNLIDIPRKKLARNLGLLLQEDTCSFPTLTQDAILLGRYAYPKKAQDSKALNDIMDLLDLNHLANRNLLALSGGERRRVSIARLCYQHPEIYLLDEPLNHLDPIYQQRVLTLFKDLCQMHEAIVIMAGHNLEHMQNFCDHFLLMLEDGNAIVGSKDEVFHEQHLRRLYG